jgi:heme-degrading monooxygenase HmoA
MLFMKWITSGMAAEGMLGGMFSRLGTDRYLVTSWWSSADAHHRYVKEDVSTLRRTAGAGDDRAALRGYGVVLEPAWLCLGAW